MPVVHFPSQLRRLTGSSSATVPAGTVSDIIDSLDRSYPGLKMRLRDEVFVTGDKRWQSDEERRAIDACRFTVSVNGTDINALGGSSVLVHDGDDVTIAAYGWYRVTCTELTRSTRWRKLIDDLRSPDGELPPAALTKSALQYADPTEWLEALSLQHEMALYDGGKDARWPRYVRASLGHSAKLRGLATSTYPGDTMQSWLAAALGVDPLTETFEREAAIMCTSWWVSVICEFHRGDVRSTSGPKDRSKDMEE